MSDLEFKINALKEMDKHIIEDIGDDDITDYWLTYGVPDDASEDTLRFIAESWDCWLDVLKAFVTCLKMNDEM